MNLSMRKKMVMLIGLLAMVASVSFGGDDPNRGICPPGRFGIILAQADASPTATPMIAPARPRPGESPTEANPDAEAGQLPPSLREYWSSIISQPTNPQPGEGENPDGAPVSPPVTDEERQSIIDHLTSPSAIIGHILIKGILDKNRPPNILVIMPDDVGWYNISAFNRGMMGATTPNIDRVGVDGAIFQSYYGQQSCTAGRGAFITGLSPMRTGLTKVGLPGAKEGIQPGDATLGDLLKPLGYTTVQYGKNHLGDRNEFLPTVHGFDEFFGFLYHLNALEEPYQEGYPAAPFYEKFGPREIIDCVSTNINDPREDPRWGKVGKQKINVMGPLAPWPEDMPANKERGIPKSQWNMTNYDEVVTQRTVDFLKKASRDNKPFFCWYNPSRVHVWTNLADKWKDSSKQGLYMDGMTELDSYVGQILDTLDSTGLKDNTIVIVTTDNGAESMTWPDGGITPFHGEKGTTWDGGMRVPLLVRWPGVIPAGIVVNDIMSAEDWVPTLLDAAGNPKATEQLLAGKYKGVDKNWKGHLDGYDFLPYFASLGGKEGKQIPSPRHEIMYMTDNAELTAVRYDDWKVNFKTFSGNLLTGNAEQSNVPLIENLRQDPFEKFHEESLMYGRWWMEHAWVIVPMQHVVGKFLMSFKDFPPSQSPGDFGIPSVQEMNQELSKGGGLFER